MPEKATGWRKKIHGRPKDIKVSDGYVTTTEGLSQRRRQPDKISWRSSVNTPTILHIDAEDAQSEMSSEVSTPHRPTMPKLSRYLPGYLSLKEVSKEPGFIEPWSESVPLPSDPPVDPLVSAQFIYTHMNSGKSIPRGFNSTLFRILDDYRKVREEKGRLDALLQETFENYKQAEGLWVETETKFRAEIRRLELLIVREGTSGMAGLMRARRDSIVKHRRTPREITPTDRLPERLENMSSDQLEEQMKLKIQKILLQRPSSPSSRMVALSKQFSMTTTSADDFSVGTPPRREASITLSRRVKSELDLSALVTAGTSSSIAHSVDSGFSRNGDPLPDEVEPVPSLVGPIIEWDAFTALQELGVLIARRKNMNTGRILSGLKRLFITTEADAEHSEDIGTRCEQGIDVEFEAVRTIIEADGIMMPKRRLRHSQSQTQLNSGQRRQRHFSFEPGDDQIGDLEKSRPMHSQLDSTFLDISNLNINVLKPSKIPSPVQRPGFCSVRRESSLSSLQHRGRRISTSTVITASRQNSSGSLLPISLSRSSSVNTMRQAEDCQLDSHASLRIRNGVTAADPAGNSSIVKGNVAIATKTSGAGSSIRQVPAPAEQSENSSPHEQI